MFDNEQAEESEFAEIGDDLASLYGADDWSEDDEAAWEMTVGSYSEEPPSPVDERLGRLKSLLMLLQWVESEVAQQVARCREVDGHLRDGYTSMTALIKHTGGMTGGRARRLVTLARMVEEAPETVRVWRDARISTDQVMVLAAAQEESPDLFREHESWLVETVRSLSLRDTRRAVEYWRQASVPEAAEAAEADLRSQRRFGAWRTLDGAVTGEFFLDPEAGDIVLGALEAAMPPPNVADNRTATQRRCDGFVDLCLSFLGGGSAGGARPSLSVLVDLPTLLGEQGRSHETLSGEVLSREAIRRIGCDSAVRRLVLDAKGLPVELGRRTRVIPGWLREAVSVRDRHCVFPGCDRRPDWCDAHHLVFWSEGGETDLPNLVLLCRYHHTLVHEGGFRITGTADDFSVYRPDGLIIGRRVLEAADRAPP